MNASENARRYKILRSQEDGVWLVEAVQLQGVRSFGRTVNDAARNIREAIAAAEDLDEWDDLNLDYRLEDKPASDALSEYRKANWRRHRRPWSGTRL